MTLYRLYTLRDDGHVSTPPKILDCEQDQAAVEAAKMQLDGRAVELWDGPRRVAKLEPDRPPSVGGRTHHGAGAIVPSAQAD